MRTVHVLPVHDLVGHEEEGIGCPCGPTVKVVLHQTGLELRLVNHHSLDRAGGR